MSNRGSSGDQESSDTPIYGPSYSQLQVDVPGESLEATPNTESGHILGGPGRGYDQDQGQVFNHDESGSRKRR